jgi:hypothetical protein
MTKQRLIAADYSTIILFVKGRKAQDWPAAQKKGVICALAPDR